MAASAPALGLALVLLTAAPAAAHTELVSSTPAPGASVAEVRTIELRFSEGIEVAASHVWIEDTAGYLELSPPSPVEGVEHSLSVPVPPLGDGTYSVTWHVLAADGAPAQGTFSFTLAGSAAAPAASVAPPATLADPAADFPPDTSLAVPIDRDAVVRRLPELPGHGHAPGDLTTAAARTVLDASLATLVGGLAFVVAVWPQGARLVRTRQLLWIAALLAGFASFELAAFQHAAVSGLNTAEALSPWHQWDALQFRFGRIAAVRAVLLGAAAVLTARLARDGARATRSITWLAATTVVVLGLAETLVLLGHTSGSGVVASGARLLHVLAVTTWIGGLVMLLCVVVPRRRVDELLTVLPRFSALATGAVVILTAGGVLLAVDLVGTAGALPSTGYGRVLLAKLAVVGVLLYAASRSRRHVRACLRGSDQLAAAAVVRPLAVWVGTEVGLVAVVLGLTALLVTRIPPG
jgi:putative copper export protein/methionine-rich copper-binding protein CopC